MNIIIAGAGKVGFNLAKSLCVGHEVTIIDKNSEALHRIEESLDILPINGDVEDPATYHQFLQKEIDLFIAVTNIDNVNLISALIIDNILHVKKKFVRLQNHFYQESDIKEQLKIDKIIFPTQLASSAIASLLHYPKANNVKFFKYTKSQLISVRVSKDIQQIKLSRYNFIVVGIERDKEFIIPKGDVDIYPNDLVYCFGLGGDIKEACNQLEFETTNHTNKCVVFGGGELGISIAKSLLHITDDVKLIEKDLEQCQNADELLGGKVSIINSKYGASDIFEDEGLEDADIFIAATNNDEFNIIKCLEAKDKGINKVIAINNEMEYYNLMHSLGIIVVRGPKMSAYNTIMEHIGSTGIIIQKSFCGAKAHVFMRKVFASSKFISKKLKPFHTDQSNIYYLRDEKIYPFIQKVQLEENDIIVAFCSANESPIIKHWIYEL